MEYSLDSVTAFEFLQYCSLFFRQWNFIFLIILPCMRRIMFLDPGSISEVKFAAGGILVPFRGRHLVYHWEENSSKHICMAFSWALKRLTFWGTYHSGSFGVNYLVLFLVYRCQNLWTETSACGFEALFPYILFS
jgi:hypothetical protein